MTHWRRPAWWSVLVTLAGVAVFVRLGVWQLHRADEKEALLRRFAAAEAAAPVAFDTVGSRPPADVFPRVRVAGRYLVDRAYLLDNPRHDARGGVEVYVPLARPGDERLLLVDLGFLPGDGAGHAPQPVALPETAQALQGLYLPPPGVGLEMGGDALAGQAHWPKTTIYLDLAQVARDLKRPLYPRVLALDPDPASPYVRRHQPDFVAMPPARHRAYAFQWFSFAVAAIAILVILHRPRAPRPTETR